MKRFDKGYIYYGLISNLFISFMFVFAIFGEVFSDDEFGKDDFVALLPLLVIIFAVIYVLLTVHNVLYYRTSGYELTESEIKCKCGVIFRRQSVIDYTKIHAINKKQGLIQRIFGIAVLTIDSGSANTAHQAEITIIEKSKTVDALINKLNALKEGDVRNNSVLEKPSEVLLSSDDSLFRFTSKRKVIYSLINIVTWSLFVVILGVIMIAALAACKLIWHVEGLGTWGQYFLYSALITVAVLLLLAIGSFIGSILHSFVGYHNFAITKCKGNIQISYGLFERHTNTFSYDRIKAVKISQGLVQRMLGFASIKLEVIGYTNVSDNGNAQTGVLVPFCKYDEVNEILKKIMPEYIPDEKQTKARAFFPFVSWYFLLFGTIIGAALLLTVVILLMFKVSSTVILTVALAVLSFVLLSFITRAVTALLAYINNGIATQGDKITVYNGSFIRNIAVFKAKHLVAVEDATTPLRKKAGITSLILHIKTNAQTNEVRVDIQSDILSDELAKKLIL